MKLALLAATFILASCGPRTTATSGKPAVLRYCFTQTGTEDPISSQNRERIAKSYLERTLKIPVQMVKSTAYGSVIEAFRSNKIDAASISPFSYVIASQKIPIEAIAMLGPKSGGPGQYRGVLAVPAASPIRNVDDLVKHTKELTISFVDPASTSGFLVQMAFFQSRQIDPRRDFKKVTFSLSHAASLLSLIAGKTDVAASLERLIDAYEKSGKMEKGAVRTIWTSPPIPNQPIAVRKELSQSFKDQLRQAFLDMPDKDPEMFANIYPKGAPRVPGQVFIVANDSTFDGLREVARGVKNIDLLEK